MIVEQLLFQKMEKFYHRQKVEIIFLKDFFLFQLNMKYLDHKPDSRKEKERIVKAGGHVTKCRNDVARVEHILAVSRALGDYSIDKNIIPPSPDITQYSRKSSSPSFVILACDGLWDVMENEQVAKFVAEKSSNTSLQDIASQLADQALQLGSMDNISVYVIKV